MKCHLRRESLCNKLEKGTRTEKVLFRNHQLLMFNVYTYLVSLLEFVRIEKEGISHIGTKEGQ